MSVIVLEGPERATDVLLVATRYYQETSDSPRRVEPFESAHLLAPDLWLGPVDLDLCDAIATACTPPGENFHPVRNFGFPYGFVRTGAPTEPNPLHFDSDARIAVAVQLSRLVHPTSIDFRFAARLREWTNPHRMIVPARVVALNPHAFVLVENADWLIPDDVDAIRALIAAYSAKRPPRRVLAALFHHENAARTHFIDARWPILVTGIESLVRIRDEKDPRNSAQFAGSTRVFVRRVEQLARELGVPGVSEADLREVYGLRSELVHGLGSSHLDPRIQRGIALTEELLRAVLRKAVLDPTFAARFESDAALSTTLPL